MKFVIYDKDLCKHWKNGFFCDKIDRKSVLWTHTSQTVTGKREREKVEFMSLAVVTLKKRRRQIPEIRRPLGI